ncbi:type II secretion system protein GspM [Comamonas serinivorans]|nr:type II secretion system protein GspM [Comamonas serinivorans]
MNPRKPRPEWLWLLLFAAVLAAIVLGGAGWLLQKHAWAQDRLKDVNPRYAMMTGLIQDKDKLAALQQDLAGNYARYVHPATAEAGQAGNEALQRVRELASDNKLGVVSSQVMPARDDNGLERIGLNLRVEGDYDAMTRFLQALGRVEPVIYSDTLQLTAQGQRAAPRRVARGQPPPPEEPEVLKATAQLTLFVLRAKP